MNSSDSICVLAILILLSSTVPAIAQAPGTDARIEEFTYSGEGAVTTANDDLSLWRSATHQFSVTISTTSGMDGAVCLVTVHAETDTESELACESTGIAANRTETVAISVDEWPVNLTGSQAVSAVVRPSNSSDVTTNDSVSLAVIRKSGDLDGDGLPNEREVSLGTGLRTADSDGDGLADGEEVNAYETAPVSNDTDGDGLSDRMEIRFHETDPTAADTDEDGLPDSRELELGTNPNRADSDGDGRDDGAEVNVHETDPLDPDSDDDGVDDRAEIRDHETNPLQPDTDGDGLADGLEVNTYETDPNALDTDGDGLEDGAEVHEHRTGPANADTDGDGLTDGAEVNTHGTNPTNADTDGDGLGDGVEVDRHGTNPNRADTDGDGTSDRGEVPDGGLVPDPIPLVVLVGLAAIGIATSLAFYRSDRGIAVPVGGWLQAGTSERTSQSSGEPTPQPDGSTSQPGESTSQSEESTPQDEDGDGSADSVPPEFLSNEEQILRLLEDRDGRIPQARIVDETGWSKSKVSRVLSEMADDDLIEKINVGGRNVVACPDDLPPGARSPFDE